jgi:tetratricopeptide (TPR) repeat protein
MTFILRSRAQTIAVIGAAVVLLGVGFLPLFGGPGYEISLVAGLLLPSFAAAATALDTIRRRAPPFDGFSRGVASGALIALAGYATTLVHGLRAGFCDPLGGTILFALGPGWGAVMGGAFGAIVGEVLFLVSNPTTRKVLACVAAPLGPVIGILLSVWRFFITPTIFAFDPFFGYFSGTLYDTVIDAALPLLTYRAGSALTLIAAGVVAAHLAHDENGKPVMRSLRRPGLPLLGAACATASLLLVLEGWRLGHWQTSATIERDLGARLHGDRCDVVYPRSMRTDEAELFARDCDAQLAMVERFFETGETGRVTAFLFRNSADKRRLMGAGDTFIAKPWRHEVYLQPGGFPHPVLGHELAHVVAGSFAPGPFHIAASFRGLKPNPGLIEGAAVAASPDDDALTPAEWSRSMLDLGILPPLDSLFSFDFLGQNASKSYTVAGAFVRFVKDKFGAAVVRNWYGGGALAQLSKTSWGDLDKAWRTELGRLKLPDAAAAVARARFDRPSVWGRRCPHRVDLYRRDAEREQDRGDLVSAERSYEDLLKVDPHDESARLGLANCFQRHGELGEATRILTEIAGDEGATRPARNRALSVLADIDYATGDYDRAAERYALLASRTLDEDSLRTIEVKASSLSDPRARRAVAAYLVGSPERGVDAMTAGALLGSWIAEDATDGLPEYLLGRDLGGKAQYAQAAERFDRALSKRLPAGRVLREALRQRVIVACALGDVAAARKAYDIWTDKGAEPFRARRDAMTRLIERCGGARRPAASSGMK